MRLFKWKKSACRTVFDWYSLLTSHCIRLREIFLFSKHISVSMVMPHCTVEIYKTKNLLLVRLCPAKVKKKKKKYTCNDAKCTELFFPLQSLFYPVQYIGLYITEMILSIIENCNWASHFRRIRLWFSFIELYLFF